MRLIFVIICLFVGFNVYSKDIKKVVPQYRNELVSLIAQGTPLDKIDTSKITDMSGLFSDVKFMKERITGKERTNAYLDKDEFKGIETWDTSNVTDMSYMFRNQRNFNEDISSWNVAKVKEMRGMFGGTYSFEQNLNAWAVSEDCDVKYMFEDSKLIPKVDGYRSKDKWLSLQEILKIPQWYLRNSNDTRIIRIFVRDFLLEKLKAKESLDEMQQAILANYLKITKPTKDLLFAPDFRIIQKINGLQKVPDFALYKQGFKSHRDYFVTKYFDKKNKDFINTYFEIPEVCDYENDGVNDFCAVISDDKNFIMLSLKKPLKLRGVFVFEKRYIFDYKEGYKKWGLKTYLSNKYFNRQVVKIIDENFNTFLPSETQKGFSKYEVEVEFEVANKQSNIPKNANGDRVNTQIAYGLNDDDEPILNVKNVKFLSAPKIKFYSKKEYMDRGGGYTLLSLNTQGGYVNIRKSPNGKVLQKIFTKDESKIFLISPVFAEDIKANQWIQVLYFPPNANVNDARVAINGYIHSSQIKVIGFS